MSVFNQGFTTEGNMYIKKNSSFDTIEPITSGNETPNTSFWRI